MIGFLALFLLIALPFSLSGGDIKGASQISGIILIGLIFYFCKIIVAVVTSWWFWLVIGLILLPIGYWFYKL